MHEKKMHGNVVKKAYKTKVKYYSSHRFSTILFSFRVQS